MTDTTTPRPTPRWIRWLAAVGIVVPPERKWHVHLRPRFFALIAVGFVGLLVGTIGLVRYSESPSFCNSCHIMTPYYEAWKTSKHNHVACVECHYPPERAGDHLWRKFQAASQVVKYITRTYSSKPFAEVEDAACLRSGCHSTRLLQGKVFSANGIKFDHTVHVMDRRRGRQLRCVSCHSQVVVGRHVEVTYDTCYLCHFKGRGEGKTLQPLGGCLACHDVPSRPIQVGNMIYKHEEFVGERGVLCQNCHLDVVAGTGKAPQDRCYTCHNQPEKLAKYDDIPFLHENHVTKHQVACFHCHEEIRHGGRSASTASAGETPESLVASTAPIRGISPTSEGIGYWLQRYLRQAPKHAHQPTLTFECGFCHEAMHAGQLALYSGKVQQWQLPEIPSPMYQVGVDCVGCHYESKVVKKEASSTGKTFLGTTNACVKCHGPEFAKLPEATRAELTTTLEKLEGKRQAIETALAKSATTGEERRALDDSVAQVRERINLVRAARGGEHNIYLASVILRGVDQQLSDLATKLNVTPADLSNLPLLSGSYCGSLCHTTLGIPIPAPTVTAFGKTMPHGAHTAMMACVTCHDIRGHKEVPLHEDIKSTCQGCHPE